MTSCFADVRAEVYKYKFRAELFIHEIHGGTPTDAKKAEGWIRMNLGESTNKQVARLVEKTMAERGVDPTDAESLKALEDELVSAAVDLRLLNGFKRDDGELYIEGRQVKAMIKEAANIRWPKDRWGPSRKGTRSFFAEHVFVADDRISLGVVEPSDIEQRFVHTWRGSSIQYEEFVLDAKVGLTVITDHQFTARQWAELWVTAESNGLGASRSRGHGTFEVTAWDSV
jgi:hypothetical protein